MFDLIIDFDPKPEFLMVYHSILPPKQDFLRNTFEEFEKKRPLNISNRIKEKKILSFLKMQARRHITVVPHVTRLKVAPSMADPISLNEKRP